VSGGDAFSSQSQRPLHFGLGLVGQIEKAEVHWPSGIVQIIEGPELNRYHEVVEEEEDGVVSRSY
jgi:enediyne biosynthesis protein E4